ncbi:MAG: XrtY-associated glycosyltransferase XYAG1 [Mucilaginibacter sp.]
MKLLQINASYKPAYIYGGPTMSVSKLSEEMVKAGCEVEVFTTTANGFAELAVKPNQRVMVDGVPVTYFKRLTKDHSHFSPALLRKVWNNAKSFDVVHIHAWWNLVSVFSCLVSLMRGSRVVISPRGTLSAYSFTNRNNLPKSLLHNLLGKPLLKRCYIHVTSLREKQGIESLVRTKTIFNIPNFVALKDYDPMLHKESEVLRLLFFSRIEEKKGLEILFHALAMTDVPYHLTIAGNGEPGYIEKLKELSKNNNIAENISWIGFQGSNKFDILQQHDVMVLPSYDENFGNVVIESLSVGTAVLISKHVGLADYVETHDLGWVSEQDAASFSSFIKSINAGRDKLAAIRKQAPEQIRKDFDENGLREQYINMYHQIIANG